MILDKFKIKNTSLKNRIVISPMCQYSSKKGVPSQWHYKHLLNMCSTGAAMLIMESTAVDKNGRISEADLCLYNDQHQKNLTKLIKFLRSNNDTKIGIQISHSGRKGSCKIPWIKHNSPLTGKKSWQTFAPSAISKDKNWPVPKMLSINAIKKIINKFKNTAIRARKIGFDSLEIHMAHGYLLHQFFSPISNKRTDMYGGTLVKRSKLLLEVAAAVKKVWPSNKILGARITGTDHLKNGVKLDDAIYLSKQLKKIGFDYLSVSSGGILSKTEMKQTEAFRSNIAKKIKNESKLITTTSGLITKHKTALKLIKNKKIDFITIARVIVKNPGWIYQLAAKINKESLIPKQNQRIFNLK